MNLLKYKSLERINEIEDFLIKEKIYLSKIDELNDPNEKFFNQRELPISTWESIDSIPSLVTSDARVFCLSSGDPIKNRKKMWKNYADNGSGVCIVFKYTETNSVPPEPIRYVSANEFQNLIEQKVNADFYFIKENIWSHEAEYRFAISGSKESLNSSNYRDFSTFGLNIETILYTPMTKAHKNFYSFHDFCKKKNLCTQEVILT